MNPDVIAARVNRHEGTKRWDLLLGLVFILPTMLALPIVAALDDSRYPLVSPAMVGSWTWLCPFNHGIRGRDLG